MKIMEVNQLQGKVYITIIRFLAYLVTVLFVQAILFQQLTKGFPETSETFLPFVQS